MINTTEAGCDLLIISPHTDDAEIGLGGTIRTLANRGRKVWALDLTRGELGTNATPDERWLEAADASEVLGLQGRVQLELPDGFVSSHDREQVGQVVNILRRLRPRWVATAPDPVRHPDHIETPLLVRKATFMARLGGWQPDLGPSHVWTGGDALPAAAERWAVEARYAVCSDQDPADVIFDISDAWEAKVKALHFFKSQFWRGDGQKTTEINDPAFLGRIERRARNWGRKAGVELGEALRGDAAAVLDDMPNERWLG